MVEYSGEDTFHWELWGQVFLWIVTNTVQAPFYADSVYFCAFQCIAENSSLLLLQLSVRLSTVLSPLFRFSAEPNILLRLKSCQCHWQALKMNRKELRSSEWWILAQFWFLWLSPVRTAVLSGLLRVFLFARCCVFTVKILSRLRFGKQHPKLAVCWFPGKNNLFPWREGRGLDFKMLHYVL